MHKDWKRHPLSEVWGDMPEDEFRELVEDVREHGVHEPIMLHVDGRVLDGWHRYKAAIESGRNPPNLVLPASEDAKAYVISKNLRRRHLTAAQRATRVARVHDWAPPGRPRADETTTQTREEIAGQAGVSVATVGEVQRGIREGFGEELSTGEETPHSLRQRREQERREQERGKTEPPAEPMTRMEKVIAARDTAIAANREKDARIADLEEALDAAHEESDKLQASNVEGVSHVRAEGLDAALNECQRKKNDAQRKAEYWRKKFQEADAKAEKYYNFNQKLKRRLQKYEAETS